eukprot:scaffold58674_cov44-Attheya_sp.AAC.6
MGMRTDSCIGSCCQEPCQRLQVLSTAGVCCRLAEVTPTGVMALKSSLKDDFLPALLGQSKVGQPF